MNKTDWVERLVNFVGVAVGDEAPTAEQHRRRGVQRDGGVKKERRIEKI